MESIFIVGLGAGESGLEVELAGYDIVSEVISVVLIFSSVPDFIAVSFAGVIAGQKPEHLVIDLLNFVKSLNIHLFFVRDHINALIYAFPGFRKRITLPCWRPE